jgi:hypothetical protein
MLLSVPGRRVGAVAKPQRYHKAPFRLTLLRQHNMRIAKKMMMK